MTLFFLRHPLARWATAFCLLSAPTALLPAAAQVPQALPGLPAWTWQNPRPTGYKLRDVHVFDDQNAFVVGDHGTALRTRDQGRTWQPVDVGTTNDLWAVSFASPLVGWVSYNTPSPDPNFNGRGEVRKTIDGGLTWTMQLIGEPVGVEMQRLTCFSATMACVYYFFNQPGGRPGRVRFTTDGGQTWGNYRDTGDVTQFLTPQVGYTVALGNVVRKTTDGGLSYTNVSPASTITGLNYNKMWFVNAQNGYVASTIYTTPTLFKTTNGGQSWTRINQAFSRGYDLHFADLLHGTMGNHTTADGGQTWLWAGLGGSILSDGTTRLRPSGVGFSVGDGGNIRVTNDFGRTTLRRDSSFMQPFFKVHFNDPLRGWAVTFDRVARTRDRGLNWQPLNLTAATAPGVDWSRAQITGGAFPDADTVFLVGREQVPGPGFVLAGFVLKTVDGGNSWVRLPVVTSTVMRDAQFRNGRQGLLVGDEGRAWRTLDGGQSWQQGSRGTTKNLGTVAWADARTAYAVGDSLAFVRTADGGLTWQPVVSALFTPSPSLPAWSIIDNICFTSAQVGFYTDGLYIHRTTDAGRTWTSTVPNGRTRFNHVSAGSFITFRTPREGWATGEMIRHTIDGGLTWQVVADISPAFIAIGSFQDPYNGWVASNRYGGILAHYSEKFLTATPLAQTTHCAGAALSLAFATTGTFPAAERRFKVELSNARGRFRPGQIRVVGQGTASPLAVVLPATLAPGSGYRLRVVQADSLVLGADTGQDITINAAPTATISPAAPAQTVCAGSILTLTAPAGQAQYLWSTGATTPTLAVNAAGTYTVRVAGASGCLGSPSAAVTVTTAPLPATPVIQQSPAGQLAVPLLAGATYRWSRNGTAIAGATGATYPATGAAGVGTYTVVVTSALGCASAASAAVTVILATRPAVAADFSLYPNPTQAAFTIERPAGGGAARVAVLDALGRWAWQETLRPQQTQLTVQHLPAGVYVVQLHLASGEVVAHRLVVVQ